MKKNGLLQTFFYDFLKIQVTNWVREILVTFENQSSMTKVTSIALAKSLQNINLRSINLTWCKAISEDSTKNCWKYHYRYSWNTAKVDIKHQSINHYHKYINRWNNTYIFILFFFSIGAWNNPTLFKEWSLRVQN
jgi:hypothetical protein